MLALDQAVRQGKALYVGLSNYTPEQTREATRILRSLGTSSLIHQPKYNLFERSIEDGLLAVLAEEEMGCIVFSPLAQGLLTNKYLAGIPDGSRVAKPHGFLHADDLTEETLTCIRRLRDVAQARGQTLAQMALAWVLRHRQVTSALVGASRVEQIEANVAALENLSFSEAALHAIEEILSDTTPA